MNIANAILIPGWMEPNDLEWLARQASCHRRIAEIGCWMGRSTMVLADNTSGVVYAIDHFKGSEEHQDQLVDKDPLWLRTQFEKNLRQHIGEGKVVVCSGDSGEMSNLFHTKFFDMVFIDGSHDHESVRRDILMWKPMVRGLLCGHDAGHPPVYKATHELLVGVRHEESMWLVEVE